MSVDEFLGLLPNARASGRGYRASCPTAFHERGDRSSGLSISPVDDRILIHCHAGCTTTDVCDALGIGLRDLFFETRLSSRKPTTNYRERLETIEPELWVIAVGVQDALNGELSDADAERIAASARRLAGLARLGGARA